MSRVEKYSVNCVYLHDANRTDWLPAKSFFHFRNFLNGARLYNYKFIFQTNNKHFEIFTFV